MKTVGNLLIRECFQQEKEKEVLISQNGSLFMGTYTADPREQLYQVMDGISD